MRTIDSILLYKYPIGLWEQQHHPLTVQISDQPVRITTASSYCTNIQSACENNSSSILLYKYPIGLWEQQQHHLAVQITYPISPWEQQWHHLTVQISNRPVRTTAAALRYKLYMRSACENNNCNILLYKYPIGLWQQQQQPCCTNYICDQPTRTTTAEASPNRILRHEVERRMQLHGRHKESHLVRAACVMQGVLFEEASRACVWKGRWNHPWSETVVVIFFLYITIHNVTM